MALFRRLTVAKGQNGGGQTAGCRIERVVDMQALCVSGGPSTTMLQPQRQKMPPLPNFAVMAAQLHAQQCGQDELRVVGRHADAHCRSHCNTRSGRSWTYARHCREDGVRGRNSTCRRRRGAGGRPRSRQRSGNSFVARSDAFSHASRVFGSILKSRGQPGSPVGEPVTYAPSHQQSAGQRRSRAKTGVRGCERSDAPAAKAGCHG